MVVLTSEHDTEVLARHQVDGALGGDAVEVQHEHLERVVVVRRELLQERAQRLVLVLRVANV